MTDRIMIPASVPLDVLEVLGVIEMVDDYETQMASLKAVARTAANTSLCRLQDILSHHPPGPKSGSSAGLPPRDAPQSLGTSGEPWLTQLTVHDWSTAHCSQWFSRAGPAQGPLEALQGPAQRYQEHQLKKLNS